MGVRVLYDSEDDSAVLYDSVTMTAFGPIIDCLDDLDARDVAERLIAYCRVEKGRDARTMEADKLVDAYIELRKVLPDLIKQEDEEAMREDD